MPVPSLSKLSFAMTTVRASIHRTTSNPVTDTRRHLQQRSSSIRTTSPPSISAAQLEAQVSSTPLTAASCSADMARCGWSPTTRGRPHWASLARISLTAPLTGHAGITFGSTISKRAPKEISSCAVLCPCWSGKIACELLERGMDCQYATVSNLRCCSVTVVPCRCLRPLAQPP